MSEEESRDNGGDVKEEVLDSLLPKFDEEDNAFMDEDEAIDKRKRASARSSQNPSPQKKAGDKEDDEDDDQGAEEENNTSGRMEADEDTKEGADDDDEAERKKKELQRRRALLEAENAEREKALAKLKEEAMEFDESERDKKKRLEEEARKIKEKIKQELKSQEKTKPGEKRKNDSDSDDSDSDSSSSDSSSDSDSDDEDKKKEKKKNGEAKGDEKDKENRDSRKNRISPIRFEPSDDRRNTGDLLDDRVADDGPPGAEGARPGPRDGAPRGGGGGGGGGPVDFAAKLKYIFRDARFFLMKSHNFENVSLAKAKGVWSTPPQNEYKINQAFDQCSNVILVFSVKESGRFQGFARVAAESSHSLPPVNWVLPPGLSSRALGGIFKIDWVSRKDLSFNVTSSLYNRWNDGKPVKIGRDGQEIEPFTGDQLCRLFPPDENIDIAAIAHKAKVKYRSKRDNLGEDAMRQMRTGGDDRRGGRGGRRSMSPGRGGPPKRMRRSDGDYDNGPNWRNGGRRDDGPSYSDYMRTYHHSRGGMMPHGGPPGPWGWGGPGPYDAPPSRADRSYEKDVEAFLRQTSSSSGGGGGRSASARRPNERSGGKERRRSGSRERDGKRRDRDEGRNREGRSGGRDRDEDRRRDRR